MGSSARRLLNQSAHSRVAYSTASRLRQVTPPVDDFGLVGAVDRLREGVVVAVADGDDEARLDEALGVVDRHVLHAAVRVVDEAAALEGLAFVQRQLQRVEHEARKHGARHSPTNASSWRRRTDREKAHGLLDPGRKRLVALRSQTITDA